MQRRRIVVNMWGGARTVRRLGPDDLDPTAVELAAIEVDHMWANGGVRPIARIMQDATIYRQPLPPLPPLDPSAWP